MHVYGARGTSVVSIFFKKKVETPNLSCCDFIFLLLLFLISFRQVGWQQATGPVAMHLRLTAIGFGLLQGPTKGTPTHPSVPKECRRNDSLGGPDGGRLLGMGCMGMCIAVTGGKRERSKRPLFIGRGVQTVLTREGGGRHSGVKYSVVRCNTWCSSGLGGYLRMWMI